MATSVGCHAFWFWVFWPFSYAQQLACWSVAGSSGPKHTCTPKYNAPTRLTRFFFGFFFSSSWPRHNNDVWWCGNWDEDAVPPFTPLAICRCLYAYLRPFFKLASFSDSDFNWLVQFAIGNASRMYKHSCSVCLRKIGIWNLQADCTYSCVFGTPGTPEANIFRNEMSWGNAIYMDLIKQQLIWTAAEE